MNRKIYFDCEFTGLRQSTDLISIGLVSDTGDTLYCEFSDFDKTKIDDFVLTEVLPHTDMFKNMTAALISDLIAGKRIGLESDRVITKDKFLNRFTLWLSSIGYDVRNKNEVQFVGDLLTYDWVLLNELWGGALNIPNFINYIPLDICTLFYAKGIDVDTSRKEYADEKNIIEHHALEDARIVKKCFERLVDNG